MTKKQLRAAVYCRISRDATGTRAGVDRQRDACLKLAADRGWDVDPAHIIVENDVSATRGKRPGYTRLMELASAGTVDVIVAWHVDRLTRKMTELETLIETSERTGVRVATVSGDLDLTTDSGRLVGRILASVARGEVERKGARQRAANAQRAEQGKPPPTRAYGYNTDGTIRPDEAKIVRDLFARFVAGAGIAGLTTWLGENGHGNTQGATWSRYGVRHMLLNPRYVGERWANGEFVALGVWEALVDEATFRAAASRLSDPARTVTPGPSRKWIGSGLYRCGVCDDDTRVQILYSGRKLADGTRVQTRMYRCAKTLHLVRKADEIDDLVTAVISQRLRDPRIAARMVDDRHMDVVRVLRDEAVGLRARSDSLAAELADGLLTARQVHVASRRIEARLGDVEAQLAELGSRSALAQIATTADPVTAWLGLDVAQRAAVVDGLATVTLLPGKRGRGSFDPETVRVEWKVTTDAP
jgi:DNA invertase Pin-like site-specific DNA recombinase